MAGLCRSLIPLPVPSNCWPPQAGTVAVGDASLGWVAAGAASGIRQRQERQAKDHVVPAFGAGGEPAQVRLRAVQSGLDDGILLRMNRPA
mgnify:CR=1 FL=1